MPSVSERIQSYNAGRLPDQLRLKYKGMKEDCFRFYRGSAHLFYEDLQREDIFMKAPLVWICGDLHLENFGSYKGDDGLTYFDISDFDEALLAPFTLDVARLVASIRLACLSMNAADHLADDYIHAFLDSYEATAVKGKARHIHKHTARGLIEQLLNKVAKREDNFLLEKRTEEKGTKLEESEKQWPLDNRLREDLISSMENWLEQIGDKRFNPDILDAAFRIAGTGSLGLKRYVLLTGEHRHGQSLLDVKEACPSAALAFQANASPAWTNEAARVIWAQGMMQSEPAAQLSPFPYNGSWYVVHTLQPTEDKLELDCLKGDRDSALPLFTDLGMLAASAHLRTTGHKSAATADALMAFLADGSWKEEILRIAREYCIRTVQYFNEFRKELS